MATEPARRMHAGLRRKLGPALADDVITVLAPLERDELALHSDIVCLEAKIDTGLAEVRGEIKSQTVTLLAVLISTIVGVAALAVSILTLVR